jgi:hypothetical protein
MKNHARTGATPFIDVMTSNASDCCNRRPKQRRGKDNAPL